MTSDEETHLAQSFIDEPRAGPILQLRLHHFFAMTAVAAVLLALHGQQPAYWSVDDDLQQPRLLLTAFMAWAVLNVLIVAIAVTAVAYGIVWQRMGLTFFNQPGHWLLVEIAIVGLFGMVPTIIYRWIFASFDAADMDEFPMFAMFFVMLYWVVFVLALPVGLNIYFGIKKCREWRWSRVFFFKAAAKVLMGLGELVVLALVLRAMWRDRQEHTRRDSSHLCGAVVQCALSSLQVLVTIFSAVNMYIMFSRM